ncbi:MAG: hypothetical protein IT379_14915 [Deltaproteobacteria bacterium]|nr:hypothetical protein [Deltaproteobacteria bacterium]
MGATADGPRLVTALSLNPGAALASGPRDFASWSRAFDLSIVAPFDLSAREAGRDAIDYVGIRVRINILAPVQGGRAFGLAVGRLRQALDENADRIHDDLLPDVLAALRSAPDRTACMNAIASCGSEDVSAACGGRSITSAWRSSQAAVDAAVAEVRGQVDGDTVGLDLRADFGDQTFSGESAVDDAFSLQASAAGSWRFLRGARVSITARGRIGYAYRRVEVTMDDTSSEHAVDWGASLELAILTGPANTLLSVGVEGRWRTSDSIALPPLFDSGMDYADLRIGLSVPLSDGTALGVGLGIPIDDNEAREPMLTVSGDWSLLLGALQGPS